jgi:hypothetical protein
MATKTPEITDRKPRTRSATANAFWKWQSRSSPIQGRMRAWRRSPRRQVSVRELQIATCDARRTPTIGRRKLGISNLKLEEVLPRDFAGCSALAEAVSGQDAAVFCLVRRLYRRGAGRGAPYGLHRPVRASSPRQQPQRGFLVLERERRGPDGTESDGLGTLPGGSRKDRYSRLRSPGFT